MMANKDHEKYISYFKDIASLTTIDIPNQPNAISGKKLKEKFKKFLMLNIKNIERSYSINTFRENDILIITGSLYLSGEFLNLN